MKIVEETNIDLTGKNWRDRKFRFPGRTINLATTFSGIGAIEYAIKYRLGLDCEIQFAGDIDRNCMLAYQHNYGISPNAWHTDVRAFHADAYKGKVDLLVGGAPCQTFSIVGKKLGFDDTRGTLFREYARLIKECEPKVFIFENVQGLYQHDHGQTWEVIRNTFQDYCGYNIFFRRLNSKNYGIPQHRERLFCVGFKDSVDFKFPAPDKDPCPYCMYDFLLDYRGGSYYLPEFDSKVLTKDSTRASSLASGAITPNYDEFVFKCCDIEDKHYLSATVAKYVLAGGSKGFKTSKETDLSIARPLLQSMHKMHRAGVDNYVTFNKEKGVDGIRRLSPRECLRLMGFRDDFDQVVSDTATYMEAGNSIVVDVLIALLKQMDITKYGRKHGE